MNRQEAIDKLISVRHHCFVRVVLGNEGDFRMAFRDLNRLYVLMRDEKPEQFGVTLATAVESRRGGRPAKYTTDAARRRAKRTQGANRQRIFRIGQE